VESRPPWFDRRRRTLIGLALGIVAFGLGAVALPGEYGLTSAFLAALCAFALLLATIVFIAIPGPDTLRTLLAMGPLAGAVLVVAFLLLLSTDAELRWLWSGIAMAAAAWTATAVWQTRRRGS
jgi:Na+/H+-translocating membrane pyrophosphatase